MTAIANVTNLDPAWQELAIENESARLQADPANFDWWLSVLVGDTPDAPPAR